MEKRKDPVQGQTGKMRHPNLFVAVPLPDAVKQAIAEQTASVRNRLSFRKWVHPADYHITVKFLGGIDPKRVDELRSAIGPVAGRHGRFVLRLEGPGTFGPREAPRILWLGVGGDRPALDALQQETEQALSRIGFEPDRRRYTPHVTVARQWTGAGKPAPADMGRLVAGLAAEGMSLRWEVEELVLYRTQMGNLPMYERLDRYPLG